MKTHTVQLFITCILDTLYPHIGQAVLEVLERAGAQVEFPSDQTCCGQPAFNAGLQADARQVARHTIQVFERTRGEVVIPSGSCAAMVRNHYPALFADEPDWLPRAQSLANRTFEFSEYLVDVLHVTDFGASFPGPVTYHPSCHLTRDLGVRSQPLALLACVRQSGLSSQPLQVNVLPNAEDCCGFGGVFSAEHPEISTAMMERKIDNFRGSGAGVLVACDAGCLTHINGGLRRQGSLLRGVHLAEVLNSRQP